MSRVIRVTFAIAALLGTALPIEAQRFQANLSGGPTWRGTSAGDGFDAMSLTAGVGTKLKGRWSLSIEGGVTLGTSTETIPLGMPCDIATLCQGTGEFGILVPGSLYSGQTVLAWTVPGARDRLEVRGGAGVYGARVVGGDVTMGFSIGGSVAVLPWLHLGADATRLISDLGRLRWMVSPAIQLRLR
jgi:hypothetical protein